jgi:hypothetical protein
MIDSINFMPVAMFGFSQMTKGSFPHLCNRRKNEALILNQLPYIRYYNTDRVKIETKDALMTWYDKNRLNTLDFQKEILKYCRPDVDILRRCCLQFRADVKTITNIDHLKEVLPLPWVSKEYLVYH